LYRTANRSGTAILTKLLGLLRASDIAEHTALLCTSSIWAILARHRSCPFSGVIFNLSLV
jgi:hypothetical protein